MCGGEGVGREVRLDVASTSLFPKPWSSSVTGFICIIYCHPLDLSVCLFTGEEWRFG